MRSLSRLTDGQMARVAPGVPKSRGDDRRVLPGILVIDRNGLRWCKAPEACGPHKALYTRRKRWRETAAFARIRAGLAAASRFSCTQSRWPQT